jgi:hypothetical protein
LILTGRSTGDNALPVAPSERVDTVVVRHETAMSSPSVFTPRGGLENSELAATTTVLLRVEAAKNNQAAGIRWARDYEFGATLGRLAGP